MWRKMIPLFALSAVLLVGCNGDNGNNAVPNNNETPMEDVRDDASELKNDVERDIEGRDFDNGNTNNNNGMDNGVNQDENTINRGNTNQDNNTNR